MSSAQIKYLALEAQDYIKAMLPGEPFSWEFAEKFYKLNMSSYVYRSNSVGREYGKYNLESRRIWDDISSVIKHEVFGMQFSFDRTSNKRIVEEPICGKFVFCLNLVLI